MKATTGPQSDGRIDVGKYKPEEVTIIGIDTDDKIHPLLDRASNEAVITESDIKFAVKRGVMVPIKCKRDGNRLIVVAGRGRTRKLRAANERIAAEGGKPWLLPVEIIRGDENKLVAIKNAENHHRRVLDPMQRASDALDLAERIGAEEAAIEFGVSLSQLKNILALNDLAPAVAKAVTKGTVSATAASHLAALSTEEQEAKLTELLASGEKPTVARAANKAREAKGKEEKVTPKGKLVMIASILEKIVEASNEADLWKVIGKIKKVVEK